ncbi:MAG TPA: ABC transporter permease, partial [Acidimicrobiia bacterium]|nr:ABC transporter permease [Acidimicrobiia bacterium]
MAVARLGSRLSSQTRTFIVLVVVVGLMLLAFDWTPNLLFIGLVQGLIVSVLAMGIVLVYRSSRIINFAIGDLGVPAAAILGVLVAKGNWPYWPALIFSLLVGTASGTVVELAVIRRLFKAPRVIVLVATIGVAEFARAVALVPALGFQNGELQASYPTPMSSSWHLGSVTIQGSQLLVLIVVPLITVVLWWLLGHTAFGESVRASATNADLARLTGISPKMMSTAIWTITGFLSAVAVILYATTTTGSAQLVAIGPETLLLGLTAALIGEMTSFPLAVAGAISVGLLYQILFYNYTNTQGLVQFVLFLVVLVLVARMRRADETGGESFSFAPRVPPIPERLRRIWWVRRMPQMIACAAVIAAVAIPYIIRQSEHHETYAIILATAVAAISVTVLTGWAGQLSLGQAAFAGIGGLTAAALVRGLTINIGWHAQRLAKGSLRPIELWCALALLIVAATLFGVALGRTNTRRLRLWSLAGAGGAIAGTAVLLVRSVDRTETLHPMPFGVSIFLGAVGACIVAVAVGIGALRVKGLLLAISTLAFAIAAEEYIFPRPFFVQTEGSPNVELPRGKFGPFDLTVHNRAYYLFTLAVLIVVLVLVGHLRRTGIGRMIIGVRENEPAAAALTVSPTRAKLTAFAMGGFLAGLGGALLGATVVVIGYGER